MDLLGEDFVKKEPAMPMGRENRFQGGGGEI
jgi:hypothetical protein